MNAERPDLVWAEYTGDWPPAPWRLQHDNWYRSLIEGEREAREGATELMREMESAIRGRPRD